MYQTDYSEQLLDFFKKHSDQSIPSLKVLEEFQSKMNRATVYRKLNSLVEQKLVRKSYNLEKKCYEYQYGNDCDNHLHLICKSCGKLIHLNCESAKEFVKHICKEHDFVMDQGSTMIFGLCKECSTYA